VEFSIHGTVRSGNTRLPGVAITAAHSLTGRKVITSSDIDGSFRLVLPGKGRWVLRAEFSAFAGQTAEVVLTPSEPQGTHDFELILLSRVPKVTNEADEALGQAASSGAANSGAGTGRSARRLTLSADDAALAQSAAQSANQSESDASLGNVSGLAASADSTNESVSVTGRMGSAQDFGLQNMDDLRDRLDQMRARGQLGAFDNSNAASPGSGSPGGPGGGPGSGGPASAPGAGFGGGPGQGGFGGGGGSRFRTGSLNRMHGQIYYNASNAVLDAAPYSVSGQPSQKPGYGSNKIGATLGGPLKIPHIYDDGGKTFVFMNYSGIRSSTPYDVFSHVPTAAERGQLPGEAPGSTAANFCPDPTVSCAVSLFDPTTGAPLGSQIPVSMMSPQALYLLGANPQGRSYIPLPNVTNGSLQNYRFSSASEADQDIFSLRLTHNLGAATGQRGTPGMPGGGGRGNRSRNNLSFGINYQRNETGTLEPFSTVGGATHTNGFAANTGWAVSRGKLSNQLRFTWNRSRSHSGNYYANAAGGDIVDGAGIGGVSDDPLNWGVPNLAFAHYTGLNDVSPSQSDSQTFSLSDSLGWVRGKHHLHFGGDYRWINNKAYASSNPRGTFTFTGSSTAAYVTGIVNGVPVSTAVAGTGYDFADFLLGYAQQTSVAYSQVHDQYLSHSYDLFVQDDWWWKSNLTLNIGLRYEFIAPFHEANNELANTIAQFDASGDFLGVTVVNPNSRYGRALMNPQHDNFAPRIGIAWKPLGNKTVMRAGYGINYNLGQYALIVRNLAAQPPMAVTATNAAAATAPSTLTLADGFPAQPSNVATNNFGIDPNYRVAYVQMWNLNLQHELTPTLLVNVGYTGSKGSALDMMRAPNRGPDGVINPNIDPFNWETSQGSSILHAGSLRVRKRMTSGFAVGSTYTYSKSIDNASSIGGGAQVVAQDDRNLRAERGLSIFDQRQKLSGDWTLELPWGEGRKWLTRPGVAQKALGDWLLQSTFTVASGTPFTARVEGSADDVAGGVNGALRANYNGEPIQIGERSIRHWFNTAAFSPPPAGTYGDSGRNMIIGPGSWLFNLVLSKNFPLRESMGLEMRAEADNVLNHANYSAIDTTVNSPTYGQVTSVSSMRKMILSLHYRF
jgi:hypothetical protein